jgi:glycosyltransferase involved in cell wall biosynthesis
MPGRKKAVMTGMIATYPVGGVVWDYGQYLLGLESLGFDVYYLEDTGCPTYDPHRREYTEDCAYGMDYLARSLRDLSPTLGDRWHFRSSTDEIFGLSARAVQELLSDADILLNVSGGTLLRDEYMANRCKILIDSDPGWNHFVNFPKWDANPGWLGTHGYRAHDYFFTYAERLGADDCSLPDMGLAWGRTRPPVHFASWQGSPGGESWTTVMTWNNFRRPVEYQGRTYGTKEMEFPKIEAIPSALPNESFTLAVGGSEPPMERWRELGWRVVDSHDISVTPDDYRRFIQTSRGEISVAKNLYVDTRSGWFSCRSVCYLAAGLPVVVQDTGFSEFLPTGNGLFAFSDGERAAAAIREVAANYRRHQAAAREMAREYFGADRVLGKLLADIGLQ